MAKSLFLAQMGTGLLLLLFVGGAAAVLALRGLSLGACVFAVFPFALYAISRTDKHDSAERRKWSKYLLALAIVDAVVVCALVFLAGHMKEITNLKAPTSKSVIGVVVEEEPIKEGLKVSV